MSEAENFLGKMGQNVRGSVSKPDSGRTPDFTAPRIPTTRPKSFRGVTFHFAHKVMSKRSDISQTPGQATTSSAHQGYIERPGAVAELSKDQAKAVQDALTNTRAELIIDVPSDELMRPPLLLTGDKVSFGTLGATPTERKDFWTKIEVAEGRTARVQSRIIAELPCEVDKIDHLDIVARFAQVLDARGLPFHAVVHAPGPKNDKRNHHLHIAYYDRPCFRTEGGLWCFEVEEEYKTSSRQTRRRRPLLSKKSSEVRARGWVKNLRREFADCANEVLSEQEVDKRYDARSYRESGVAKRPTVHLGSKSAALEAKGLDTERGRRNANAEMDYIFAQADQPWAERERAIEEAIADNTLKPKQAPLYRRAIDAGRQASSKSAIHQITAHAISERAETRFNHLNSEVSRLDKQAVRQTDKSIFDRLESVRDEIQSLSRFMPRIESLKIRCQEIAASAAERAAKLKATFDTAWEQRAETNPQRILTLDEKTESAGRLDESDAQMAVALISGGTIPEKNTDEIKNALPDKKAEKARPSTEVDQKTVQKDVARSEEIVELDTKQSLDPMMIAIAEIKAKGMRAPDNHRLTVGDIDAAMSFPKVETNEERARQDELLDQIDNRALRFAYHASLDAEGLVTEGRDDVRRALVMIEHEATRRGLNLENGVQMLSKANDEIRAEKHRTQDTVVDQDDLKAKQLQIQLIRTRQRGLSR